MGHPKSTSALVCQPRIRKEGNDCVVRKIQDCLPLIVEGDTSTCAAEYALPVPIVSFGTPTGLAAMAGCGP